MYQHGFNIFIQTCCVHNVSLCFPYRMSQWMALPDCSSQAPALSWPPRGSPRLMGAAAGMAWIVVICCDACCCELIDLMIWCLLSWWIWYDVMLVSCCFMLFHVVSRRFMWFRWILSRAHSLKLLPLPVQCVRSLRWTMAASNRWVALVEISCWGAPGSGSGCGPGISNSIYGASMNQYTPVIVHIAGNHRSFEESCLETINHL